MNADEISKVALAELKRIAPELEDVQPAKPLRDQVDLDSMDFLNLVTALHDTTGIEVPERDYPQVSTIAGFVRYVTAHSA